MSFFHFFKNPDIHQGVQDYLETPDAILLDVRTVQEYRNGHIPGSINLPLQKLDNVDEIIENVDSPIYVYCQSGNRSRQAATLLSSMGYLNVKNIGGISAWRGRWRHK